MTAEVLAATQLETLRNTVSSVLRMLNERAALCHEFGEKCLAAGNRAAAARWADAAKQAADREDGIQRMVSADWLHPEGGEGEPAVESAAE